MTCAMPIAAMLALAIPGAVDTQHKLPFRVGGTAGASIEWGLRFASENDDWVNDLLLLRNGNVMAVGFLNRKDSDPSSDWTALSSEIDMRGTVANRRLYGEGGGLDAFFSMAERDDGSRMFAGLTTRIGGGGIDGWSLMTGPSGELLNEHAHGAAGYDRFTDIALVGDGYVMLGHSQAEGSAKRRIFVVKTDFSGRPVWQHIHDATDNWGALYIEPSGDGGFIVSGGTTTAGDGDMFAMKLDSQGRELWRKRAGTADWDEINHGLVVRPDGRIVLIGYTHKRGEELNDLVSATLTPEGEIERIERFGGPGDDRARLAKADTEGHIWIVGHSSSSGAGEQDLMLARLDQEGRFDRAAITIGSSFDDHGTALLPLDDGSILLAGYSRGLGIGGEDAFVLKLSKPVWDMPHPDYTRDVPEVR